MDLASEEEAELNKLWKLSFLLPAVDVLYTEKKC